MEQKHREASGDDRRQYVNFAFYKVDPVWRRLPKEERKRGKCEFVEVVKSYEQDLRDTPTFTCIHRELAEVLDLLGG